MCASIAASLNPKLLGVAAVVGPSGVDSIPDFAWATQGQSLWCWAAVAAMIDCVVPPAKARSQCEIGNIYKTHLPTGDPASTVDWCDPAGANVDKPAPLAAVLGYMGTTIRISEPRYGRQTTLVWSDVVSWLREEGRFCPILINFADGMGNRIPHYILATGLQHNKVVIYDPAEDRTGSHRVEMTEPELHRYRDGVIALVLFV